MNYLKTPWTRQPQQAVGIDWSNPITRGLVRAYLPTSGETVVTPNGVAGLFIDKQLTVAESDAVANSGTLLTSLIYNGYPAAWKTVAGVYHYVGTLNQSQVELISSNTTGARRADIRTNTGTVFGSNIQVPSLNSPIFTGLKWTDRSGATGTFIEGTTSYAMADGASTWLPEGVSRYVTAGVSGSVYATHLFLWNRALSDAEISSVRQNPWQIFKPLPRRIFVPVSAATGDATGTGSFYDVTLSSPTGTATGTGASNGTGTGDLAASSLAAPSATATGSALASGSLSAVSTTAPSATATGSALATGALTTVTLTTITASATGSALATGSLDAIDLSTVSGSATGTTAGNAEGVGAVATIALSAPSASAVGSALATGSFSHLSLSAVSGTASAATDGQATADLQPISISAPLAIAIASSVATGGIQSIGLTAPTGSASGQAQTIARPGSDTSNSGWTPSTGSDLYAMLDEVTPDDADYISTASAGSVCRLGLGAVADPGTSSGQVVSYRASSSTGNGLKVELMQGGTVIATWNHATLPATDTTYQQALSAAECDAITDYTALSVRLTSL